MNLFAIQKQTHRLRERTYSEQGGRIGERDSSGVWDGFVHTAVPILKWVTNKDPLYSTGNSTQYHMATWRGEEFGEEWIYVYVWLSPFAVHLKLSQHC